MTPAEREAFFSAFRSLKLTGQLEQLTTIHNTNSPLTHNGASFLVWHRAFMAYFQQLMSAINGAVVVPYWNWALDAAAPHQSPVLSSWMVGSNGEAATGCVRDGVMGSVGMYHYPTNHCLQRRFNGQNGTITPWWNEAQLLSILTRSTDYQTLRSNIENGPHPFVHGNIGGDLAVMISPNDIIFFLHHGMVDRLYYMWQLQSWTTRRSQYNGQTAQNQTVQATDVMPGLNSTAAEYFDPSSDSLCYTYDDLQTAQASTVAAVSALPRDALRDLFPT
ncbi:Di-copper centre-containing protein, partial [Ramicandelaber brevisporus]